MKVSVAALAFILVLQVWLQYPVAHATRPGGTVEGDYALHIKNPVNDAVGYVSPPADINLTLSLGRTYSIGVSLYIATAQGPYRLFELRLDPISIYFEGYSQSLRLNLPRVNAFGGNLLTGVWYNIEAQISVGQLSDIYQLTLNGTIVTSGVTSGLNGLFVPRIIWLGSDSTGEVYVDNFRIRQDDAIIYSKGFEDGLRGLQITRYGGSTLDTAYFGIGTGLESTLISFKAGSNETLVNIGYTNMAGFGALLGSDLRLSGTVHDATTLTGVSSSSVLLEFSNDRGRSFQQIGPVFADRNGDFSLTWRPPKLGLTTVRASYDGNCCFFGSATFVYLDVTKAFARVSVSLSSSPLLLGFSVGIEGSVRDVYSKPLQGADVVLAFTVSGAPDWTTITSAKTGPDGEYQATWIPQATGTFMLRATWSGDSLHRQSIALATLTSTLYEGKYVFSVASDSTISAAAYDPSHKKLQFAIQGSPEREGYADVTLPKALVADPAGLKVSANGSSMGFQSAQSGDTVRLHLAFTFHSSYQVEIVIGDTGSQAIPGVQAFPQYLVYLTGVALVGIVFAAVILRRRSRTAEHP